MTAPAGPGVPWGVTSVTVRFGRTTALRDVTCPAPPGRVTAVVGGDGAGKTTLLRCLAGTVSPVAGHVAAPPRRDIGFMPTAGGVWRDLTVDENIAFVASAHGVRGGDLRRRRGELLAAAGLTDAAGRIAGRLSGGMRQKLAFSLAVLHRPRLLVLDEPSTGIDPVSRVDLWRLIAAAAAEGTAVVMTTTYLDEAERAAHVVVLDAGRVLRSGTPDGVVAATPGTVTVTADPVDRERAWRRGRLFHAWHPGPAAPGEEPIAPDIEDAVLAAALADRAGRTEGAAGADEGEGDGGDRYGASDRSGGGPDRADRAGRADGAGGGPHGGSAQCADRADRAVRARRGRPASAPLASAERVTRRFGAFTAVDDVTVEVRPGEIVGLLGANGAGKTTLLRMLLGLVVPTRGAVRLFGAPPSRATRVRLGYVPQGLGLWPDLTVRENAAFARAAFGGAGAALTGELAAAGERPAGTLSLGLQRRLAFALALGHRPDLLVLDEPTSGVDPLARARLWDVVHDQADAGAGVLVTTHYMQEAQQCDRLVLMSRGRAVATGREADIIGGTTAVEVTAADWPRVFGALAGAGLPVTLAGRRVRVAGTAPEAVRDALTRADVEATVRPVRATLEETMTLLDRADAARRTEGSGPAPGPPSGDPRGPGPASGQ